MKRVLGMVVAFLIAAPVFANDLYIDLRTNYSPRTDFGMVRVEVIDQGDVRKQWVSVHPVDARTDFVSGARVAELHDLESGHTYMIVLQALDAHMRTVDGRLVLLDMPSVPFAATVLMTRR